MVDTVGTLSAKHEIKSRFITLNLALNYIDPQEYLKNNKYAIQEMINLASETVVIGKYALNYFEEFLRKLWQSVGGKHE